MDIQDPFPPGGDQAAVAPAAVIGPLTQALTQLELTPNGAQSHWYLGPPYGTTRYDRSATTGLPVPVQVPVGT
jgi:hypothetical protein